MSARKIKRLESEVKSLKYDLILATKVLFAHHRLIAVHEHVRDPSGWSYVPTTSGPVKGVANRAHEATASRIFSNINVFDLSSHVLRTSQI